MMRQRAIETYIHADTDYHQLGVETNKWFVLLQAVLLNKSDLNSPEEIVVQCCVDQQDQNFLNLVPDFVDPDKYWVRRLNMRGDPNTKDSNVNSRDEGSSAPFDLHDGAAVLSNKRYPIDDNLHEKLDFEDP